MTTTDTWSPTPARGYTNTVTHPPFEDGNEVALKHGAWSPRRVDPLATEILEATRSSVTWWRPADMASAWAWAQTEARRQLVTEWLMDHGGDIAADGEVRPAARLLDRLDARAESLRSKLGLDPLSRARLGRDVAAGQVDVARLMAALGEQERQRAASALEDLQVLGDDHEGERALRPRAGREGSDGAVVDQGVELAQRDAGALDGLARGDGVDGAHGPDGSDRASEGVPPPPESPASTTHPTPSTKSREHGATP